MEFQIDSKKMLAAMNAAARAMAPKQPVAILDNCLFSVDGKEVTVTAGDAESTLSLRLDTTSVDGAWGFCLAPRPLIELLRKMGSRQLTFRKDGGALVLSHAKGKFYLPMLDSDGYPRREEVKGGCAVCMDASSLARGIERTEFAVASGNQATIRPILGGILMDLRKDAVIYVATDTHMLSKFRDTSCSCAEERQVVIPLKVARTLSGILPAKGLVEVRTDGSSLTFRADGATLTCSVTKGSYPPYDRVIPQMSASSASADREAFLDSLRRVGVCANSSSGTVSFAFSPFGMVLESRDPDWNRSATENFDCDFDGPELTIGFSAEFIDAICSAIPTAKVRMSFTNASRPGVFRPMEDDRDTEWTMIAMPQQLMN